jgi:hypothetical protein
MTEKVKLPGGRVAEVTGFPHTEKDGGVVMCAQAAISGIIDYWNHKSPASFPRSTGPFITEKAGVPKNERTRRAKRGLLPKEIITFFKEHNFTCLTTDFTALTMDSVRERNPSLSIYGYLESGFPVIAMVKTHTEQLHALTFIGHTFDKHAWTALADPSYYRKPISGDGEYHSNLTWVKHFIVQDDNLGPYYYLPRDLIPDIIAGLFVPFPHEEIKLWPSAAESSGYTSLSKLARWLLKLEKKKPHLAPVNKRWFDELMSHRFEPNRTRTRMRPRDGWVMRAVLKTGKDIVDSFKGHDFLKEVRHVLLQRQDEWFWKVEVSWPELFCFHASEAGFILLDASRKDHAHIVLAHLPGVLITFEQKVITTHYTPKEDAPRAHEKPGKKGEPVIPHV